MPELPEVETIRQGMERAVLDKKITSVKINRYDLRVPIPKFFSSSLKGQVIRKMNRRGKYIVMHFDSDVTGILHLGMSGRIHIFLPGESYRPNKHDHVVIGLDDGTCFTFEDPRRFGMFYLASNDWDQERPFSVMGPEPMEDWTAEDFYKRTRNKTAPIKSVLLDQKYVAGLGNIYVCEALFLAAIHPKRQAKKITKSDAEKIVSCCKTVLEKAIKAGGSSLKDYRHTDGSLGYFQHGFSVYDRKGENCRTKGCDSIVERIVQSGRSTFLCARCQT